MHIELARRLCIIMIVCASGALAKQKQKAKDWSKEQGRVRILVAVWRRVYQLEKAKEAGYRQSGRAAVFFCAIYLCYHIIIYALIF